VGDLDPADPPWRPGPLDHPLIVVRPGRPNVARVPCRSGPPIRMPRQVQIVTSRDVRARL
jgi:hypothetical protein